MSGCAVEGYKLQYGFLSFLISVFFFLFFFSFLFFFFEGIGFPSKRGWWGGEPWRCRRALEPLGL